jgi:hypothetical protein
MVFSVFRFRDFRGLAFRVLDFQGFRVLGF